MSDELYLKFEPVKLEYRLYYDAKGCPVAMSSHNHPEGQYIVITREQYERPNYNCRVINGKLIFDTTNQFRIQLTKSDSGVAVVAGHANLVIEDNETYTPNEYYNRIS